MIATAKSQYKILLLNQISSVGLKRLPHERYACGKDVDNPDAVLVRSQDMHQMAIPQSVRAIGRAGAGTNNIPVKDMNGRGVPVFNAPGANANAVKELVLAGLLLAVRNLVPALQFVDALKGDDKSLHAQIDTCYSGSLLIYDAAVESLGLAKEGTPEFFRYTDGGVNMLASSTPNIGFGTHVIAKNPKLYFVGEGKNPVHQPDGLFEGTVGNALFAHSVVTLDFHAMTMDVQPTG